MAGWSAGMVKLRLWSPLPGAACLLIAASCVIDPVASQTYPAKPIRIVTGGVGSGEDVISRLIAQALTDKMGQQVIVDNRPSGVISGEIIALAPPDGYSLLFYGTSLWVVHLLRQKVPYEV